MKSYLPIIWDLNITKKNENKMYSIIVKSVVTYSFSYNNITYKDHTENQ